MFKKVLEHLFPTSSYMLGFDPLTMGIISIGSGLLSGVIGSGGESDKEKAIKGILDRLEKEEGAFKKTPFTKDELFNTIMPAIQGMQRNAADVAAGRLGASIGETGNVAGGQGTMDYYLQTLAPVIAQGENAAADTYKGFVDLWARMDDAQKKNFLGLMQSELGVAEGLPNMTDTQKFLTNFISGANLGMTGYGNVMQGQALAKQGDAISEIAGKLQGQTMLNTTPVTPTGTTAKVNTNDYKGGGGY